MYRTFCVVVLVLLVVAEEEAGENHIDRPEASAAVAEFDPA